MNEKYRKLLEPITFPCGITAPNRYVMSPMVIFGTDDDGKVGQTDLAFYELRNNTGGLVITGTAAVARSGYGFWHGLTIYDDDNMEGLRALAEVLHRNGNLAVVQLHHGGREAVTAYKTEGRVVGPSGMQFPWMKYPTEELTGAEIEEIIGQYGEAARRAVEAGFDGVEIHGANHYLLQQFFSAYSNKRTDSWGGTLEKRMKFPLAVLTAVRAAVAKAGKPDSIVGYRITPEEVHGSNVGYTLRDTLPLIEKLLEVGIDYLHISSADYKAMPADSTEGRNVAEIIHETVNGRVPVILAGGIRTPEDGLDALHYCDMVAMGREFLVDPHFREKLEAGREDDIEYHIHGNTKELVFSDGLIRFLKAAGPGVHIDGLDEL